MTPGAEPPGARLGVEASDPLVRAMPARPTAAAGPVAFEQFYTREFDTMVRVAFFVVGSQESAEEVVQDAFVQLYQRWDTLDHPGGYLRTTVVNGCRDRLRRRHRLDRRLTLIASSSDPLTPSGAEASAARDELMRALATLPLRSRTALVLRFYGGFSEAETAEAMGVAAGTVKSSVHRGLKQLRLEIENLEIEK